jgi:hypothetical protein
MTHPHRPYQHQPNTTAVSNSGQATPEALCLIAGQCLCLIAGGTHPTGLCITTRGYAAPLRPPPHHPTITPGQRHITPGRALESLGPTSRTPRRYRSFYSQELFNA